jgi:hypothetical protein
MKGNRIVRFSRVVVGLASAFEAVRALGVVKSGSVRA